MTTGPGSMCSSCGAALGPGMAFCTSCGRPVTQFVPSAPTAPAAPTPPPVPPAPPAAPAAGTPTVPSVPAPPPVPPAPPQHPETVVVPADPTVTDLGYTDAESTLMRSDQPLGHLPPYEPIEPAFKPVSQRRDRSGRRRMVLLACLVVAALVVSLGGFFGFRWWRDRPFNSALDVASSANNDIAGRAGDASTTDDLRAIGAEADKRRDEVEKQLHDIPSGHGDRGAAIRQVLGAQSDLLAAYAGLAELDPDTLDPWGDIAPELDDSSTALEKALAALKKVDSGASSRFDPPREGVDHVTDVVGTEATDLLDGRTADLLDRLADADSFEQVKSAGEDGATAQPLAEAARAVDDGDSDVADQADAIDQIAALATLDTEYAWTDLRDDFSAATAAVDGGSSAAANIDAIVRSDLSGLQRQATGVVSDYRRVSDDLSYLLYDVDDEGMRGTSAIFGTNDGYAGLADDIDRRNDQLQTVQNLKQKAPAAVATALGSLESLISDDLNELNELKTGFGQCPVREYDAHGQIESDEICEARDLPGSAWSALRSIATESNGITSVSRDLDDALSQVEQSLGDF